VSVPLSTTVGSGPAYLCCHKIASKGRGGPPPKLAYDASEQTGIEHRATSVRAHIASNRIVEGRKEREGGREGRKKNRRIKIERVEELKV